MMAKIAGAMMYMKDNIKVQNWQAEGSLMNNWTLLLHKWVPPINASPDNWHEKKKPGAFFGISTVSNYSSASQDVLFFILELHVK